jgi:hypothetical protein
LARAASTARSLTSTAYTVVCGATVARTQAIGPYSQPRSSSDPVAHGAGSSALRSSTAVPGSNRPAEKTPAIARSRYSRPATSNSTSVGRAWACGRAEK